jgi:putative endonuclease
VDGRGRRELGQAGEAAAEAFLRGRGWRLVERDVRLRNGQIDLVMMDGSCLVLVEVKARRGDGFGLPQEAVLGRKLAKLRELAETYHQLHPRLGDERRVDVVAVHLARAGGPPRCEHIPNVVC